ncbi:sulfotransferase domain-containing protein [Gloeobacter morelensis]|uniref:Sulfotransferase domain-containing protein n=1 Tax=Gloeobacter morelensis MG652769 TaxID=2781736 RepID=A0ABY3PP77_9CYAN|nr:sulfotransferase domain-containing protein [Gloeobacter morelensis]UFP95419.1 sulfotransferase domain-containing protein [Gloeobacter morelensis MG652769]
MNYPPIKVMIAGAHKAGTTSLKDYLGQHPDIVTHDQTEYSGLVAGPELNQGYESTFARYFDVTTGTKAAILAKSIEVMYQPEAIERLWRHNPDCQIVVLLRHPIDRAYSAYWYLRRKGWEERPTFEQAIAEEPDRLCSSNIRVFSGAYLDRSTYHKHVRNLHNMFGERVQVFLVDDLKKDAAGVCRRIFQAADVDPSFAPSFERRMNSAALSRSVELTKFITSDNFLKAMLRPLFPWKIRYDLRKTILSMNEKPFTPPPMNPETRKRLVDHFAPHNDALSALLNRPLVHWNQ